MAAKIIVEHRLSDTDKWEAHGAFDDFDTTYKHLLTLLKKEGRVARLVIPGGFGLTADQREALEKLGVQHNS